jgi:hypothetical protein
MTREGDFWTSDNEYEDLAREYEQNIEITHPNYVTSNGIGHRFVHHDVWCASKVTYYEHRGSSI